MKTLLFLPTSLLHVFISLMLMAFFISAPALFAYQYPDREPLEQFPPEEDDLDDSNDNDDRSYRSQQSGWENRDNEDDDELR